MGCVISVQMEESPESKAQSKSSSTPAVVDIPVAAGTTAASELHSTPESDVKTVQPDVTKALAAAGKLMAPGPADNSKAPASADKSKVVGQSDKSKTPGQAAGRSKGLPALPKGVAVAAAGAAVGLALQQSGLAGKTIDLRTPSQKALGPANQEQWAALQTAPCTGEGYAASDMPDLAQAQAAGSDGTIAADSNALDANSSAPDGQGEAQDGSATEGAVLEADPALNIQTESDIVAVLEEAGVSTEEPAVQSDAAEVVPEPIAADAAGAQAEIITSSMAMGEEEAQAVPAAEGAAGVVAAQDNTAVDAAAVDSASNDLQEGQAVLAVSEVVVVVYDDMPATQDEVPFAQAAPEEVLVAEGLAAQEEAVAVSQDAPATAEGGPVAQEEVVAPTEEAPVAQEEAAAVSEDVPAAAEAAPAAQEEATPQETPAAQEDAPAASEDAPIVA